jgi:hypothetical protein
MGAHRRLRQWRIGGWRCSRAGEKGTTFYSRVHAEASLLRNEATDALRRGVRRRHRCACADSPIDTRPRRCVRG